MKNTLFITTVLVNLAGVFQAAYKSDNVFATAFVAAIFTIFLMMHDDNDPPPPNDGQSSDQTTTETDNLEDHEPQDGDE